MSSFVFQDNGVALKEMHQPPGKTISRPAIIRAIQIHKVGDQASKLGDVNIVAFIDNVHIRYISNNILQINYCPVTSQMLYVARKLLNIWDEDLL